MEKYTAIVRKGPTGLGIHWMQDENASSFIIESIDKDVCLVSTSPPIIKQILPNDEVLNIALFSAAKNGYYNVKMMQFKEMNIPDGLLVRLDLKRVSVRSANTTATAKLKPTTTSHFGQIQSLSTTSTKITPIAKEKPQVVSPFGSHSFTTPNKTIPSNSTNIFIQQSFISPNTVTATAAISSAYKASVDSLDSVGSRILSLNKMEQRGDNKPAGPSSNRTTTTTSTKNTHNNNNNNNNNRDVFTTTTTLMGGGSKLADRYMHSISSTSSKPLQDNDNSNNNNEKDDKNDENNNSKSNNNDTSTGINSTSEISESVIPIPVLRTPSERMVSTTSNGTGTMNMNRVNVIIRAPGHLSPSLSSESQSQQHQQVLSFSRPRTFHPMPVVMAAAAVTSSSSLISPSSSLSAVCSALSSSSSVRPSPISTSSHNNSCYNNYTSNSDITSVTGNETIERNIEEEELREKVEDSDNTDNHSDDISDNDDDSDDGSFSCRTTVSPSSIQSSSPMSTKVAPTLMMNDNGNDNNTPSLNTTTGIQIETSSISTMTTNHQPVVNESIIVQGIESTQLSLLQKELRDTKEKLSAASDRCTDMEKKLLAAATTTANSVQKVEKKGDEPSASSTHLPPTVSVVTSVVTTGADIQNELIRVKRELRNSVPKTVYQESEQRCVDIKKQLDETAQKLRAATVKLTAKSKVRGSITTSSSNDVTQHVDSELLKQLQQKLVESENRCVELQQELDLTSKKLVEVEASLEVAVKKTQSPVSRPVIEREKGAVLPSDIFRLEETFRKESDMKFKQLESQYKDSERKLQNCTDKLHDAEERLRESQSKLKKSDVKLTETMRQLESTKSELVELQRNMGDYGGIIGSSSSHNSVSDISASSSSAHCSRRNTWDGGSGGGGGGYNNDNTMNITTATATNKTNTTTTIPENAEDQSTTGPSSSSLVPMGMGMAVNVNTNVNETSRTGLDIQRSVSSSSSSKSPSHIISSISITPPTTTSTTTTIFNSKQLYTTDISSPTVSPYPSPYTYPDTSLDQKTLLETQNELIRVKRELRNSVPKTVYQESEQRCVDIKKQLDETAQKLRAASVSIQRLSAQGKNKSVTKAVLQNLNKPVIKDEDPFYLRQKIQDMEGSCADLRLEIMKLSNELNDTKSELLQRTKGEGSGICIGIGGVMEGGGTEEPQPIVSASTQESSSNINEDNGSGNGNDNNDYIILLDEAREYSKSLSEEVARLNEQIIQLSQHDEQNKDQLRTQLLDAQSQMASTHNELLLMRSQCRESEEKVLCLENSLSEVYGALKEANMMRLISTATTATRQEQKQGELGQVQTLHENQSSSSSSISDSTTAVTTSATKTSTVPEIGKEMAEKQMEIEIEKGLLEEKCSQLKRDLMTSDAAVIEMRGHVATYKKKLMICEANTMELENEVVVLREQLAELQSANDVDGRNNNNNNSTTTTANNTSVNIQLTESHNQSQSDMIEKCQEEILILNELLENTCKELEDVNIELEELKAEMESLKSCKTLTDQQITSLCRQLSVTTEELKLTEGKFLAESNKNESETGGRISELETMLLDVVTKNKELETQNAESLRKLKHTQKQYAEFIARTDESEHSAVSVLRKTVMDVETRCEALQKQLVESEEVRTRLGSLVEESQSQSQCIDVAMGKDFSNTTTLDHTTTTATSSQEQWLQQQQGKCKCMTIDGRERYELVMKLDEMQRAAENDKQRHEEELKRSEERIEHSVSAVVKMDRLLNQAEEMLELEQEKRFDVETQLSVVVKQMEKDRQLFEDRLRRVTQGNNTNTSMMMSLINMKNDDDDNDNENCVANDVVIQIGNNNPPNEDDSMQYLNQPVVSKSDRDLAQSMALLEEAMTWQQMSTGYSGSSSTGSGNTSVNMTSTKTSSGVEDFPLITESRRAAAMMTRQLQLSQSQSSLSKVITPTSVTTCASTSGTIGAQIPRLQTNLMSVSTSVSPRVEVESKTLFFS